MGSTSEFKSNISQKLYNKNTGTGIGNFLMARARYDFSADGGVTGLITPKLTVTLPANSVIVGGTINSTTAVTSAGAATLSVGTSAGSSTTSILAATAKASLSANALINAVPVFATPVKLSAEGKVTVTVGTADLTAGVVEIVLLYWVANA